MPAVLVHGVPDTPVLWEGVRAHLTRVDILALALPGFATRVPEGFAATKEAYVNWMIEQLERLEQLIWPSVCQVGSTKGPQMRVFLLVERDGGRGVVRDARSG